MDDWDNWRLNLRIGMKLTSQLISLCLFIVLAGCSPRDEKIDGSIFIVTQGGENFKLGLVTVSIFDRQQIEPYLTKTTADLEKTLKELKEQPEILNEKQNKAASDRDALEQQYKDAKDLADETMQRVNVYTNARPEFSASDESELESARVAVTGRDWLLIDELERKKQMQTDWDSSHEKQTQINWNLLKATYLKQVDEENRLSQAWHVQEI
jgi:hypothetical protein